MGLSNKISMAAPFFPPVTEKFTAAALDGGEVPTEKFLDACESILPLFDSMGMIFGQVKSDIGGNITKLRKSFAAAPEASVTLQKMVQADIANKTTTKSGSATESLLWLKRAFEFIIGLLIKLAGTDDEMKKCANDAYEATLSKVHGFMIRKTFQMGVGAVGARKDFLLKQGPDEASVITDMKAFLDVFNPIFATIVKLYLENKLEDKIV